MGVVSVGILGCWSAAAPPNQKNLEHLLNRRVAHDEKLPVQSACQVRLHIATDEHRLIAVDPDDGKPGTCIKRDGRALEVPQAVWLTSGNLERYTTEESIPFGLPLLKRNMTSLCADEKADSLPSTAGSSGVEICQWNGVYRQKYPMSFTFRTERKDALANYVSMIRVYHNGSKVFAWDDTSATATTVFVPASALYNGREPYDTAIDLHVVPADVEVDVQKLEAGLAQARRPWLEDVAEAGLATLKSELLKGTGLEKSIDCFEARLRDLMHDGATFINAGGSSIAVPPAPSMPPGCTGANLKDPRLAEAFEKLKRQGYAEAKATKEAILADLATISTGAATFADQSLKDLLASYQAWKMTETARLRRAGTFQAAADIEAAIREADRIIAQAARLADNAVLAARAGEKAVRDALDTAIALSKNTKKQAELFAAFTHRLEESGGPFDPRRENPLPTDGVSVLQMKYRDVFQVYGFGPWSGVPVRIQGNDEAQFAATTLVPILDVAGVRWQWGEERMKEIRLAAGVMYYADQPLEEGDETKEQPEEQRFGSQLNLSIFGLRIGGVVPFDGWDDVTNEFRMVFGADLYKLISGQNLEAL